MVVRMRRTLLLWIALLLCGPLSLAARENLEFRHVTLDLARRLGHGIVDPVPSLFTFRCQDPLLKDLAGVAADVRAAVAQDWTLEAGERAAIPTGLVLELRPEAPTGAAVEVLRIGGDSGVGVGGGISAGVSV